MYPSEFRYTKEHEWVKLDGDLATIGITDYAQHELGDVVYVELPSTGAKLEAGKALGAVESVKSVSEIFSPLSGEVTEVNSALGDHPEKVNEDPHGAAWLVRVRASNAAAELDGLMDAAAYEAYVAEQKEASA
ncbi:MAG TPA: glycine cleavage system protein GcvH [Patescibacteria group bacterium]|nr:glycine cleavage system protein GcvH [Patescibacteria group bacterium]